MNPEASTRYAIIGCGVIGPAHADAVIRCPQAELVAVCDLIPERARQCAEQYGGKPYQDYTELLASERPDAISVCTPHHNHAEIACRGLEGGVDVLCEKPLAISREQMALMIETARRNRRTLGGVFQHRFDPVTATLKEAVDAGLFGETLNAGASIRCFRGEGYYSSAPWRGTWDGEGGAVLINQAIHSIDVLQWFAGPVQTVFGRCANLRLNGCIETEDTACAALQFRSGALGSIEATSSSHLDFEGGVHFYGTQGSFRITTGGRDDLEYVQLRDEDAARELEAMLEKAREVPRADAVGKDCYGDSHARLIEDFVAATRNGREPRVTGESARHAVEIVLAVYESHRTGMPVTL